MKTSELIFKHRSVGSLDSLGTALGVTPEELILLGDNAAKFYKIFKDEKEDGSFRDLCLVNEPLKAVQAKIKEHFFCKGAINYPEYLHGGLPGKDLITNCKAHAKAKLLVKLDIKNFFGSISCKEVKKVWKYFFKQPEDVAEILTKLTTFNGYVPQGVATSGYIANVLFWKDEPELIKKLEMLGLTGTRFVDDYTLSTKKYVKNDDLTRAMNLVIRMFRKHGLSIKKSKKQIVTANKAMRVHKVNVNAAKPTLPKAKRDEISQIVTVLTTKSILEVEEKELRSAFGKVNHLSRFHPRQAEKLKTILLAIKEDKKQKT